MEISSGPPARNVFSVPFLFGTKPLATLPTDLGTFAGQGRKVESQCR